MKKSSKMDFRFYLRLYLVGVFLPLGFLLLSCGKEDVPEPDPGPQSENPLVITPVPVYMGMVPEDGVKAQRSVLLFNSGSQTVHISDFSISGTDAASFKVVNEPKKNLESVESTIVEIEFDPSVAGEQTAELTVGSDFGPISDDLRGVGTSSSDEVQFFRILGVQDNEGFSFGMETSDKGFICVGTALIKATIEHNDIKVVKTDQYGATLWEKLYGGDRSDSPARIIETSDGGYLIAGTTASFGVKNTDIYIIKIDSQGTEQWAKTYGGDAEESSSRVVETQDGGFLIFGVTRDLQRDVLIIKTNSSGSAEWQKVIGGNGGESVGDVIPKADGQGYLFVGSTTSHDSALEDTDIWLVEIDSEGNVVTENRFGHTIYDNGEGLSPTTDGGYVIAGTQLSEDKARQAYLLKIKSDYSFEWEKTFGGSNNDSFRRVKQTNDGNLIVLGSAVREVTTQHTYSDAFVLKTDMSGNEMKNKTFTGSKNLAFSSLQPTTDSGFVLCGSSDSYSINNAPVVMKLSSNF